uniref:Orf2 n=1 Tax=Moniliophthora roreri (strain MCA 2997) TaxID=1381753 RepID=F2WVN6_MONRO|nr:orf2 [Moniliophthora roreri]
MNIFSINLDNLFLFRKGINKLLLTFTSVEEADIPNLIAEGLLELIIWIIPYKATVIITAPDIENTFLLSFIDFIKSSLCFKLKLLNSWLSLIILSNAVPKDLLIVLYKNPVFTKNKVELNINWYSSIWLYICLIPSSNKETTCGRSIITFPSSKVKTLLFWILSLFDKFVLLANIFFLKSSKIGLNLSANILILESFINESCVEFTEELALTGKLLSIFLFLNFSHRASDFSSLKFRKGSSRQLIWLEGKLFNCNSFNPESNCSCTFSLVNSRLFWFLLILFIIFLIKQNL